MLQTATSQVLVQLNRLM